VNRVVPPVEPAPEPPVAEATPSDNDSRGGSDLAPPAISTPPPRQDLSSGGIQDQSALQNTQPPQRPNPSVSRPAPPRTPVAKNSERATDAVRKGGSNNGTDRPPIREALPLPEASPLQEALNRLRNGSSPPLLPIPLDGPNAPASEGKLQPPLEYAVTSVSAVGLVCQTVTPDVARELGLGAPRGLLVTGVVAGSPAARAGIRSNDVVLSVDGTVLRDISKVEKMAAARPDHRVPVELFRNGARRTVQLQVD
jgi:PDZ domain